MRKSQFFAWRDNPMIVVAVIALCAWVAHFWYCADFGLYEDDYTFVSPAMGASSFQDYKVYGSPARYWKSILETVIACPHGRPISYSLIPILSLLGSTLGGLRCTYLIAYGIVTLNSLLYYYLLRRFLPSPFALIGALLFCFFPACTTRLFLTNSLGFYPSLTLFLLASICYLSGRRWVSYILILASLLTYETVFAVFLMVPLCKKKRGAGFKRECVRHVCVMTVMFAGVVILRKIRGEMRVAELDMLSTVFWRQSIRQMINGPVASMSMFLRNPYQLLWQLRTLGQGILAVLAACFILISFVLSRLEFDVREKLIWTTGWLHDGIFRLESNCVAKDLIRLTFIGMLMLMVAYPLSFTVDATSEFGQSTRVHLAASIGASLICTCICSAFFLIADSRNKRLCASAILAAYLVLLMGDGLLVQKGYLESWEKQKEFWRDVVKLCPDLTDGTVILVEPEGLSICRAIEANTWNLPRVLNQLIYFPTEWKKPPRAYLLQPKWRDKIAAGRTRFKVNSETVLSARWHYCEVESPDVIFLRGREGKLVRQDEPLIINDRIYPLKRIRHSICPVYTQGHLFRYLID